MRKQFILLLLLGASVFFVQGQEDDQPAEAGVAAMIKEVLGQVYTAVGHIPEPQWFEMEPIAEEYVKVLLKAPTMSDRKEATRLVSEAWKAFQTAIDAKLTESQKSVRVQKRAEQERWARQVEALHPIALDSARREFDRMDNYNLNRNANGSQINRMNNSDDIGQEKNDESAEYVKSITIEFK